jgi:hypothetical protein
MSIIEKGNDWARKNPLKFILIAIVIIGLSINIGSKIGTSLRSDDANSNSTNSNSNSASEEVSKKAYRAGYNDGQLNYGDPSAPSYQYFLGNHPEISGADVYVYKSGYDDAVLGKPKQY